MHILPDETATAVTHTGVPSMCASGHPSIGETAMQVTGAVQYRPVPRRNSMFVKNGDASSVAFSSARKCVFG